MRSTSRSTAPSARPRPRFGPEQDRGRIVAADPLGEQEAEQLPHRDSRRATLDDLKPRVSRSARLVPQRMGLGAGKGLAGVAQKFGEIGEVAAVGVERVVARALFRREMMGAGKSTVGSAARRRGCGCRSPTRMTEIEAAGGWDDRFRTFSPSRRRAGFPRWRGAGDRSRPLDGRTGDSAPPAAARGCAKGLARADRRRWGFRSGSRRTPTSFIERVERLQLTGRGRRPPIRPRPSQRLIARARAGAPRPADLTVVSRDVPHDRIVDECRRCGAGAHRARSNPASRLLIRNDCIDVAYDLPPIRLEHSDPDRGRCSVSATRAYDIVIGRGVPPVRWGSGSQRCGRARATATATDRQCIAKTLAWKRTEGCACGKGWRPNVACRRRGRRGVENRSRTRGFESADRGEIERNDPAIRAWRGRCGRRSRRFAAILRAGSISAQVPMIAAGAGGSSVAARGSICRKGNLLGASSAGACDRRHLGAGHAVAAPVPRRLRRSSPNMACSATKPLHLARDRSLRHLLRQRCARARDRAPPAARAAIVSRDDAKPANARCSISATPSVMRWGREPAFRSLFHGEGVAIGMVLAAESSAGLGMLSQADADARRTSSSSVGLPTRLQDIAGFTQEGLADADARWR